MSKVDFTYIKGGKTVKMARRYAETLRRLGHGNYGAAPAEEIQTEESEPLAAPTEETQTEESEPLASDAIIAFAKDNDVDLSVIVGTGKDGRIKKSDVEAVIASRDLV